LSPLPINSFSRRRPLNGPSSGDRRSHFLASDVSARFPVTRLCRHSHLLGSRLALPGPPSCAWRACRHRWTSRDRP